MSENLYETQYVVTKKNKFREFYENNKTLIFTITFILIIVIGSFIYYSESKEEKKILLSENYIKAKIYLQNNEKDKATNILKKIIFANHKTYSSLSLFLILNENLILDKEELLNLFDHILEKNKFEKEIENLIIFKKAIFQSDFVNEKKLLETLNPLIETQTLWKPHALLFLGDYYFAKGDRLKAQQYYSLILSLKDLSKEIYEKANSQLAFIGNE